MCTYGSSSWGANLRTLLRNCLSLQKKDGFWGWLDTLSIRNTAMMKTAIAVKTATDMFRGRCCLFAYDYDQWLWWRWRQWTQSDMERISVRWNTAMVLGALEVIGEHCLVRFRKSSIRDVCVGSRRRSEQPAPSPDFSVDDDDDEKCLIKKLSSMSILGGKKSIEGKTKIGTAYGVRVSWIIQKVCGTYATDTDAHGKHARTRHQGSTARTHTCTVHTRHTHAHTQALCTQQSHHRSTVGRRARPRR